MDSMDRQSWFYIAALTFMVKSGILEKCHEGIFGTEVL